MSRENLEDLFDEAIKNARDDRSMTSTLLLDLVQVLKADPSKHQFQGQTAAKYLETLQRSNEQLVKITSILHKKSTSTGLTQKDKDELFDLIGEEE
jgi:hypothetical protein